MHALITWMMVFLRASSMLSVFPIFSATNFPVQLRLALGALVAGLVSTTLPDPALSPDAWGVAGQMCVEVGIGLLLGFASRFVFFGLEIGASIIGIEIGLSMPAGVLPGMDQPGNAPNDIIYYLAAMIWLGLDMHQWMLVAFQRTYQLLPIGAAAHLSRGLLMDMVSQTSGMFVIALEMAAPLMAVSFIILLIFSALGRAVPQMNVFSESLSARPLIGLAVFGMCLQLTSQHIVNYMRQLPNDMLQVAQLLRGG